MSNLMKRIFVILLLPVFLLPATGVMIYVHQCFQQGTVSMVMASPQTCTEVTHETDSQEMGLCGSCSKYHHDNHQLQIFAQPCCSDLKVFITLNAGLLVHSLKLMQIDFPIFYHSVILRDQWVAMTSFKEVMTSFDDFSPGNNPFIKFSFLRL